MEKEFRTQDDSGTEGGRSPSGVPESLARPVVYPSPESLEEKQTTPPAPPPEEKAEAPRVPRLTGRRRGPRALVKPETRDKTLSAEERLLVLDTWKRSGLPASEFAALVGLSAPTLYIWRRKFLEEGP